MTLHGFDRASLVELCDSLPDSTREQPFGPETDVWKVGGRMFALSTRGTDPARVNLKCDPEMVDDLRATWPGAVLPGYHMHKRHWNTVVLDGTLPDGQLIDMVEDSYDLVRSRLPRRVQAALAADEAAPGDS